MEHPRRRKPKYEREPEQQARREAESINSANAARRSIRQTQLAAAERERWAGVDPGQRILVIRPFGPSPHQRLKDSDIDHFLTIKARTLGYLGGVIRELDEDQIREFQAPPSWVAGREDADKLIAALKEAYPWVSFRTEMTDYVVSQAEWLWAPPEPDEAPGPAREVGPGSS
jgi:hypothetical protein